MLISKKALYHLKITDTIAEDIYINKRVLIRKGIKVNSFIKQLLKHSDIKEVKVYYYSDDLCDQYDKKTKILIKLFNQALPILANENRYGFSLNKKENLEYIKNLFIMVGRNDFIFTKLIELKNWDFYSYIHTLDVFILGNLFAKFLGIKNVREFAEGTLLYDIGKLKIPKEALQEKFRLTSNQQQWIQHHTDYGINIVGDNFSNYVKEMILHHHERLDGSGYPNQLLGKEIDCSVKLLSIVDVYSSLTLKRVDREALSATKALGLLCATNKFDQTLLFKFIEFLHIFPLGSFVLLSNGKLAKVIDSQQNAVFIPKVTDILSRASFFLPLNLSISVKKYLSWDRQDNKVYEWNLFIDYLVNKKEKLAFKTFEELSFDQDLNDVYSNIVNPALKEFEQREIRTDMIEQVFFKWMRKKFEKTTNSALPTG